MRIRFSHIYWGLGIVLYSVLFAEVFLRMLAPQPIMPRHVTAADYGVRMNVPGISYQQTTAETTATITINSLGMRGPEITAAKQDHIYRVALFGDSYFMGYESAFEDSFAARLEEKLQDKLAGKMLADGCTIQVMNFSVSGFGTAEMLRTLEAKAPEFDFDAVLFQWHHTDPADNLRADLYTLEQGRLVEKGHSYLPAGGIRAALESNGVYRYVSQHSHAYAALREHTARAIKNIMTGGALVNRPRRISALVATPQEKEGTPVAGDRQDRPPASDLDLALLKRAEQITQDLGALFFVVDIPSWHNRTTFSSSFRLLPEALRDQPNYISPIKRFRNEATQDKKIYWEKGHLHLTPFGNALVAEETATVLASQIEDLKGTQCRTQGRKTALAAEGANR